MVKFRSRSSRATGPKTLVPIISPVEFNKTQALCIRALHSSFTNGFLWVSSEQISKLLLENEKNETIPVNTTIQTFLLDIQELYQYEMTVPQTVFNELMLYKIPSEFNPIISKRGEKITIRFKWIKPRAEKTIIIPENIFAMMIGTKKAQGLISADTTFSNFYFIYLFLV